MEQDKEAALIPQPIRVGQGIDVEGSPRRDTKAVHRFVDRAIGTTKVGRVGESGVTALAG